MSFFFLVIISVVSLERYDDLIDWPQPDLNLKSSEIIQPRNYIPDDCDEEVEGVQSKERWAYVKVTMDGVIVGRKVCILDHGGYSSLALQLEEMFGRYIIYIYMYVYIKYRKNSFIKGLWTKIKSRNSLQALIGALIRA